MSAHPAKKVIRTYSRQKRALYDEEPPTKRRRVETTTVDQEAEATATYSSPSNRRSPTRDTSEPLTSSPKSSSAPWSDEVPRSSPPSSPVPTSSPPRAPKRRPVFSFLRKQNNLLPPAKDALSDRGRNVQTAPKPPQKHARMVQMQLDLASEQRKACKTCGMEYIPSNADDAALHRKFHAMNLGGVDFTKAVVERMRKKAVWSGGNGSFVAAIGRKDALALRNRISDVLNVVTTELAAVPISDAELWSQASESKFADAQKDKRDTKTEAASSSPLVDRYKTYLYIRGQKCIGACLAERVWEAFRVLEQSNASAQTRHLPTESQSSSISISSSIDPVLLGISRIWASNQHRKQGIATRLLECARSDFLYGIVVNKEQVAFSQPTESGGNLARRWFGRQAGWHVYLH